MERDIQAKKVLLVVTKSNWGGAQKYVYELAKEINRRNFDISVMFGGSGKLKEKLEASHIRTISIPELKRDISIWNEIKVLFSFINKIRKERPDVLHLNSPKAGGLGALVGRILGVKEIIFTAHGWTFNENRGPLQKKIIEFFSWLTIILCHHVIVLSEKEKEQVIHWKFCQNKVSIIPIIVPEIKSLEREEAREIIIKKEPSLKEFRDNFWVGTVAELHKNKGINYALDAFATDSIPEEIKYVVIGNGEEKNSLLKQVRDEKIKDHVFLIGELENASNIFKAFDIFLLPSVKEGLPYVIFESGLSEVPVIATDVGGISNLIEQNKSGLIISPKSKEDICDAINYLHKKKKKSAELALNLKERIESAYNAKDISEKIIALYA